MPKGIYQRTKLMRTGKYKRNSKMNFVGRRFGRLLCIEKISDTNFKYKCDCGNNIAVEGNKIRNRRSCGCLNKEKHLKLGKLNRRYKTVTPTYEYCSHKDSGKRTNSGYLNRKDWNNIVYRPCFYCGGIDTRNRATQKMYQKNVGKTLTKEGIKKYAVKMNGVDRLDSNKSHTKENCVSCCSMCNRMKNKFSYNDFMEKIQQIYKRQLAL